MADHFSDGYKEFNTFNVPPEFKPLGAIAYIGLSILFAIPIIGLVFLIVFSFSDANINRRNYARSYLVMFLLGVILLVVLTLTGVLTSTFQDIQAGRYPEYLGFLPWV